MLLRKKHLMQISVNRQKQRNTQHSRRLMHNFTRDRRKQKQSSLKFRSRLKPRNHRQKQTDLLRSRKLKR